MLKSNPLPCSIYFESDFFFTTGSPSVICVGSGFRDHLVEFGRNILELLVYYLMLNKCKNLKDMKSSCLSVCTSSLYDNEGRYFLHYYM